MKVYPLLPLLLLTACSTTHRLELKPWSPSPSPMPDSSAVRYPESLHAYHVGRYTDPNDGMILHEQHVLYRVEEGSRWNFHPGPDDAVSSLTPPAANAAFNPTPVNDAVLAEVNAQRLATARIKMEAKVLASALAQVQLTLSAAKTNLQAVAALRENLTSINLRLDALEAGQQSHLSAPANPPGTNEVPDSSGL